MIEAETGRRTVRVPNYTNTLNKANREIQMMQWVRNCVPKRGTRAWDMRERARLELGNKCLSWYPLPDDAPVYRCE